MGTRFSIFAAVVVTGASLLPAVRGIWLVVAPHEGIHFEYAIPTLLLAAAGTGSAIVL